MTHTTQFTIGEEEFSTQTAAIERCQRLLAGGGAMDLMTDPKDASLLHALFHSRFEKNLELGDRGIVAWGRESNPMNVCFAAILDDGEKLHFSYFKSIRALWQEQKGKRYAN